MQLRVDTSGSVHCVYGEDIDLALLGVLSIRRASNVEPSSDGTWYADLSPVGGAVLGPFPLRSAALDAERAWLEEHWLAASH